jgi:hypothetical protein
MLSAEGGGREKPFRVTALTGVVLLAPCEIRDSRTKLLRSARQELGRPSPRESECRIPLLVIRQQSQFVDGRL